MNYSQKQVTEGLDIKVPTYRYWAEAVPALASRAGKSAKLTFGDILALCFTKRLCDEFGVKIGSVSHAIDDLFQQLNARPSIGLEGCWLRITPQKSEFLAPRKGQFLISGENSIFIECTPIIEFARARFTPPMAEQFPLRFRPTALRERQ